MPPRRGDRRRDQSISVLGCGLTIPRNGSQKSFGFGIHEKKEYGLFSSKFKKIVEEK